MNAGNLYHYRGVITRVIDGDTVDVEIDLGLRLTANVRCRLYGINTPERGQPGYHEAAGNVLDGLSYTALLFLKQRTDWSEPWLGFGFATEFKKELDAALVRKKPDKPDLRNKA